MKRHTEKGFTLTEVTVTLTVVSILIMLFMNFVVNSLVRHTVDSAKADLLAEAHIALDIVSNDIRLSGNAEVNNRWPDDYAPDAPADRFSWSSGADTLVLATAVEDSSGTIVFADPSKYISEKNNIVYFVEDGVLRKRVIAAPVADNKLSSTCPQPIADGACPADRSLLHKVSDFSVRYLDGSDQEVTPPDARSVELSVRLSDQKYGQEISAAYTTRMVFRND